MCRENIHIINENILVEPVSDASTKICVEANVEKTKYMFTFRHQTARQKNKSGKCLLTCRPESFASPSAI